MVITAIPLSPIFPSDRLVWNETTSGYFSVRSAYHMGMEIEERINSSTSREACGKGVWSFLWSLGVPNPVMIFMWRAFNDLLPTKCNLFRRKIVEDNICPCCCRDMETGLQCSMEVPDCSRCLGRAFSDLPEM
jgi:hypothetical protein